MELWKWTANGEYSAKLAYLEGAHIQGILLQMENIVLNRHIHGILLHIHGKIYLEGAC